MVSRISVDGTMIGVAAIAVTLMLTTVTFVWVNRPVVVRGTFYEEPVNRGSKVILPLRFVEEKRLVFVDVKLASKADKLVYEGETFPFTSYRGGEYAPLIVVFTPSGSIIAVLRICELTFNVPCPASGIHIEESIFAREVVCDACGAKWDLETMKGKASPGTGSCSLTPTPRFPASINGDSVEIDLSTLGLTLAE